MSKKRKKTNKKRKDNLFSSLPKSKKGQMGSGLMVGMFVAVLVFVMMSAFLPVIIQMLGTTKGSNSANCVGYTDPNGLYSYNSSLSSDTITCAIINFTPGLFVLSIVFAVIAGIIAGKLSMGSPEPAQYQGYPGY